MKTFLFTSQVEIQADEEMEARLTFDRMREACLHLETDMTPTYNTLSAAIRARAWVRLFRTKRGREPTVEERVTWIARMNTKAIDVAYVNRSCEDVYSIVPSREK